MKRNPYSRNNIIKTYHDISELSYKTCRENLKANNWDILKAYGVGLTTTLEGLSEAIGEVVSSMVAAAQENEEMNDNKSLCDTCIYKHSCEHSDNGLSVANHSKCWKYEKGGDQE